MSVLIFIFPLQAPSVMILWSDKDLKIHACHPSPFVSQALHQEGRFIQSDAKITREMETQLSLFLFGEKFEGLYHK